MTAAVKRNRRDRAGGGVAAGQFLSDRRADPDGPAALAAIVQPGVAAAGERTGGKLSAGLRHRPGVDLPRRWACGRRQPQRLHRFLPNDQATEARRAVGGADHAATGADRELAPRGGAGGRGAAGSGSGRRLGRAHGAGRRAESDRLDPGDGGHGARESASFGRVSGGDDPTPAGAESAFRLREQLA